MDFGVPDATSAAHAGRQAGRQAGRPEVETKKKNGEKLSKNDEIGSRKARRKARRAREGKDFISLPRSRRSPRFLPSFLFHFESATDFFLVTLSLSLAGQTSHTSVTQIHKTPAERPDGRRRRRKCVHMHGKERDDDGG